MQNPNIFQVKLHLVYGYKKATFLIFYVKCIFTLYFTQILQLQLYLGFSPIETHYTEYSIQEMFVFIFF